MMTLNDKQIQFAEMIGKLIDFAYKNGYQLTFGDAYRDPRVHGDFGQKQKTSYSAPRSLHKLRLAVDFNLFRGGEYLSDTESHKPLGEYWESLGGAWGGRWGDGNHYSLEHEGVK